MIRLFIILDGIGDRPIKELDNQTPLEYAKTPNLDWFTNQGACGYCYTINSKIAPESDEAIWALLGHDPLKKYPSRGPLEAYGAGIKFEDGNLCLRANFATIEGKKIIDRRVNRSLTSKESKTLSNAINKKVKLRVPFEFKSTIGHRGVLVIKTKLSEKVSNTDPAYKRVGNLGVAREGSNFKLQEAKPLSKDKLAIKSAKLINLFTKRAKKVLEEHPINKKRIKEGFLPANYILLRDAGNYLPVVEHRLKGWLAVVGMPLEKGISVLNGMRVHSFKYPECKNKDRYVGLYKGLNVTIKESLKCIRQRKHSYYYLHFKETDLPGHDGRYKDKIKMIEILDKKFFGFLRKMKEIEFVVTADHSTPCVLKTHSSDPVPVLAYLHKRDNVHKFGERTCKKGSLGRISGKNLLKKVGYT